jgi:hypothetical protein
MAWWMEPVMAMPAERDGHRPRAASQSTTGLHQSVSRRCTRNLQLAEGAGSRVGQAPPDMRPHEFRHRLADGSGTVVAFVQSQLGDVALSHHASDALVADAWPGCAQFGGETQLGPGAVPLGVGVPDLQNELAKCKSACQG